MPKKTKDPLETYAKEVAERDAAKKVLAGEEALLTLQLLQELARGVWGSADLHFDGDCFGEFEWCVVMRGGGFDQNRSFAQGLTALQAVLAGLTVKIRGCRSREYRKELRMLQRYYGQQAAEIAERRKALGS